MPAPHWGVREIVAGIVIYTLPVLTLAGLSGLVARLEVNFPAELKASARALLLIVVEAYLLVPVWLVAVARARGSWQAVGFRAFHYLFGCSLIGLYLFMALAGGVVWSLVIQFFQWPGQPELTPLFGGDALSVGLAFIAAVVVAPVAEETFFRGFVLAGLQKRFGGVAALVISSVFFALLHPPLSIFPLILFLGILLGLLLYQTGSLWPGILMHAAFNTLGFVAQFFVPTATG